MSVNQRRAPRFSDFARAKLNQVYQLPGFLEDVSATGCRVRFTHTFEVDTDREYVLTILPSLRSGLFEFDLTVHPEWVKTTEETTEIGFSILHCPGTRTYQRYVAILAEQQEELEYQEA